MKYLFVTLQLCCVDVCMLSVQSTQIYLLTCLRFGAFLIDIVCHTNLVTYLCLLACEPGIQTGCVWTQQFN